MRDAKKGTYNGDTTYCPVYAYSDCPYCDQCNVCHIDDPIKNCDDWQYFWDSWDDWFASNYIDPDAPQDFSNEEIEWAMDEVGYNPYLGCYDDDC